jgi:hypothetical protein
MAKLLSAHTGRFPVRVQKSRTRSGTVACRTLEIGHRHRPVHLRGEESLGKRNHSAIVVQKLEYGCTVERGCLCLIRLLHGGAEIRTA